MFAREQKKELRFFLPEPVVKLQCFLLSDFLSLEIFIQITQKKLRLIGRITESKDSNIDAEIIFIFFLNLSK
jgi:hypothetical protein